MILAGQLKNLLIIGPLRTTQLEDKVCIFVELSFKNKNKCERCEVELLNKNNFQNFLPISPKEASKEDDCTYKDAPPVVLTALQNTDSFDMIF